MKHFTLLAISFLSITCGIAFSQSPTEEALLRTLREGPGTASALETVLKTPDEYSALVLFVSAGVAFKANRLEDSGFLFYSAQLRYRFDKECFPPKGTGGNSPLQLYWVLSNDFGMAINPAVMAEPTVYEKVLNRIRKWVPKAPKEYDPGYEFLERKSEEYATKATERDRLEFITSMENLSSLLNDEEYFGAFRVVQAYNFSVDDKGPTIEAYDNAAETMKRLEKTKNVF